MKKTFTLILIFLVGNLFAQQHFIGQLEGISSKDSLVLKEDLKLFQAFRIDINNLNNYIKENQTSKPVLKIGNIINLPLVVTPNDIRSNRYKSYLSDGEKFNIFPKTSLTTYKGQLTTGSPLRLTISDDFFYLTIWEKDKILIIEQLKYILKDGNISSDQLVAYYSSDIMEDMGVCGTELEENKSFNNESTFVGTKSIEANCMLLEVATDADFEFFQIYGANSNNRILAEFNNIEEAYATTYNIQISIIFQNVWSTESDPYNTTSSSLLIDEISSNWSSNFSDIKRDIIAMYTGKVIDANVVGRASAIGDVCSNNLSRNFTMNRLNSFTTLGHEIGHNFGGVHGDGLNCGTPNASVMCQGQKAIPIYFSNNSITTINNYLSNNSSCLFIYDNIGISGPSNLCVSYSQNYILETPLSGSVQWTLSNSNAYIVSGQGTYQLSIVGNSNGSVTLTANIEVDGNVCGIETISKEIHIGKPGVPSYLIGPSTVLTGAVVDYQAGLSDGATSYEWRLPYPYTTVSIFNYSGQDWQLQAPGTSRYAKAFTGYAKTNGYVQVMGRNACGTGGAKLMYVTHGTGGGGSIASIDENSDGVDEVAISPNPTSNRVTVRLSKLTEYEGEPPTRILGIKVLDQNSRERKFYRFNEQLREVEINVAFLTRGLNFLIIITDQGSFTKKLLIE